jgi:hypothetical protein
MSYEQVVRRCGVQNQEDNDEDNDDLTIGHLGFPCARERLVNVGTRGDLALRSQHNPSPYPPVRRRDVSQMTTSFPNERTTHGDCSGLHTKVAVSGAGVRREV